MLSDKSQETRGDSPLLIEGKAPLDVLVERLGITQKQFCLILDIGDTSTYRSWRAGKPPRWSTWQAKKLDELMRQAGLAGIQDLPDDLSRYGANQKAPENQSLGA